ncbi:phospholipase D-like domain-containing protein [Bhargavaea beijingensis]|uniref:phospholipase D-like domain-containing protein n=1 Tax=Bhargavaea beijingensis TaxID=426756 RepID=UPI0022242F3D|nr:phospholipase D-like domain-containing protein [Bhargavaea beijingensis]MCW1929510.1 phospholipase D-like domain-containing protein [Bhargavaea beijingensis]
MEKRELILYSTMIETLKHDSENYDNSGGLLTILGYSEIKLFSSGVFSRKRHHSWEDVIIRVKIPLLQKARTLYENFEELIIDCYSGDNQYELQNIKIKPKQISSPDDLEIQSHSATFSNIREEIIQSIRMAKHSIWISVAWFKDEGLYQELCKQKLNGVHIRILISDEDTNKSMVPKLKQQFETKIVNRWGYNNYNRLHSKYCIIDYSIVLHGSFNWTPTANQNEEHLTVSIDRQLAEQYTENFKEIFRDSSNR